MCNVVAVYLTSVQFILQVKFCLYTVEQLLLEKFKISLKSSLSTQSLCHKKVLESDSDLGPESESESHKNQTPHPWFQCTKLLLHTAVCIQY